MNLTDQQRAAITNIMSTPDGRVLRDILECYILELKNEVLDETLVPKVGKAAIGKLQELANKMAVLSGEKPPGAVSQKMFE